MKLGIRNRFKRIFLTVIIASLLFTNQVIAAASGGEDELTLAIDCKVNNTYLIGVQFDLYLVATIDDDGNVTPTNKFGLYEEEISNIVENPENMGDDLKKLTVTLEDYIELYSNRIQPEDSGVSNQNGKIVFPTNGKELVDGLYLVIGHNHTQDGYIYEPTSFMTFLPYTDEDGEVWRYVRAVPKFDYTSIPTPYTPSDEPEEPEEPGGEPAPTSDDFPIGEVLSGSVDSAIEGSTEEPTTEPLPTLSGSLPQTGQLWWPIPFLLAGGLILIILGFVLRRTDYEGQ